MNAAPRVLMGRPRKSTTVHFDFRGIAISLYPNARGTWEAGFTIPGQKRDKSTGSSEKACRDSAVAKIRLLMGAEEFAAKTDEDNARRLLQDHQVTLTEAARCWLSQHGHALEKITVAELRLIWLSKRGGKKGKKQFHHGRSLTQRSKHLVAKFGDRPIASITVVELTRWQDDIEECLAGRTARNIHDAAKDLWKFARKRGYLVPDRLSAMEQVDRPKAGTGRREIYSPEEMQRLVDTAWGMASPAAIPLVISGFGFLRSEELCCQDPDESMNARLAWEDFRWTDNFIHIREEVSKTDEARSAGLPPNLKEMLLPRCGVGPIYPGKRLDLEYQKIVSNAGIAWKYNALRHSCLTYAMLLAHNATEVATKAGNSVAMIESNYRNRTATMEQALQWNSIKPGTAWGSALLQK
jgi:hypothetical protein